MNRTKKVLIALTIIEKEVTEGIEKGTRITIEAINVRAEKQKFAIEKNAPYTLTPLNPLIKLDELLTDSQENTADNSNLREYIKEKLMKSVVHELLQKTDFYEDKKEK